ncbi:hypothetical protein [Tsukamurella pseudospumae]|uniref:HTH cro/C1-type domain-containing protein n=1 Tax=Tsukamurella pseudospumae TaxID=239498 RepID=A0A137YTW9_9ACTN|nr:hypothetical protein [Tsukamurella pseudospumae]KXO89439.1 hypothetical protein AXK61_08275 [Tsukamurella pseudospumae]
MTGNRSPVLIPFCGADLRTRRAALGLHNRDSLHRMLGYRVPTIEVWERNRSLGPALDMAVVRLARIEKFADTITASLIARAETTGVIRTYRTDDEAAEGGTVIADAALHRVCAGRAAAACPDARLVIDSLTDSEQSTAEQKAAFLVRLAMLGLTWKPLRHATGINPRIVQLWLAGDDLTRIFPDQMQRIADMEAGMDTHRAVLLTHLDESGFVPVAYSDEDLAVIDPDTVITTDTHRVIAGDLLADDFDARARWVNPPPPREQRPDPSHAA